MHRGYEYSRSGNPTRTALEQCLASLEPATVSPSPAGWLRRTPCCAPSPPRWAGDTRQRRLRWHVPPDRQRVVAAGRRLGRRRPHRRRRPRRVVADDTGLVWLESPTNPLLTLHRHRGGQRPGPRARGTVVVDNTFATPYLQQPLALGADVVVLGDEVPRRAQRRRRRVPRRRRRRRSPSGCATCRTRPARSRAVRLLPRAARRQDPRRAHGPPLHERPRRRRPACAPPGRRRVYYPQLPDHPGHAARRQMADFGGMVSFTVRGAPRPSGSPLRPACSRSPSRSAPESLIEHPGR